MGVLGNILSTSGLVGLVGLLTWITTSRGSAAATWREMTKDLRQEVKDTQAEMKELREKIDKQEETNDRLTEENRRFRVVLGDMLRYLTEMAQWEEAGQKPPPPYKHTVLLARLSELAKGLL